MKCCNLTPANLILILTTLLTISIIKMKMFVRNLKMILFGLFFLSSLIARAQFPTTGAPIFGVPGGVAKGNLDNLDKNIWVKVNGNMAGPQPHNKMHPYVTPGSKVDVNFNVNKNGNRYTLVSYTVAPNGLRKIYDYQSNFYNASSPSQGNSNQQLVLIPTCKFEVYFVKGTLVTQFNGTVPGANPYVPASDPNNPYTNGADGNVMIDFAYGGSGQCTDCPVVVNNSPCVFPRVLEVIDLPSTQQKELIFSVINNINTTGNGCGTGWPELGDIIFTNINPSHTGNNQPYSFRYNYQLGPAIPSYPLSGVTPPLPSNYQGSFVFDQRNNHNVLDFDVYQSEIVRFKVSYAEYARLSSPTNTVIPQICVELSNKHPDPHQTLPPVYCADINFVCQPACTPPTATITGPDSLCPFNDTPYTFTTPAVPGATYVWNVPDDFFIDSGQGTNSISVFSGEFSGNISVTVTNTCGSDTDDHPVTVLADCGGIIVLPVELTTFKGSPVKEGIALNWTTASEENNDRFEIERSLNGHQFEKIGSVQGSGTSNTMRDYNYLDKTPVNGLNYYRLKQVDLDGKHAVSKVIKINTNENSKDLTIQLNPNPCRGENCVVQLKGFSGNNQVNIELRDITGKLIFSQQLKADQTSLVLPKITSGNGIYLLSAKDGLHSAYQKVIIQ